MKKDKRIIVDAEGYEQEVDGCSGYMDKLAIWINRYVRRAGDNRTLAFSGCCDKHDEAYNKGGPEQLRKEADRQLRLCIKENLIRRNRGWWVSFHVPWLFWIAVRVLAKKHWNDQE